MKAGRECLRAGGKQDLWGDLQVVQSSWNTQSLRPLQQAVPGVPASPAHWSEPA